jgi:oligopeptide transport system ATP-binding protein
VESGSVRDIFRSPAHPYTRAPLEAVPRLGDIDRHRRIQPIAGFTPNIFEAPPGCRFRPCCRYATELCAAEIPPPRLIYDGHSAACHYAETLSLKGALELTRASESQTAI